MIENLNVLEERINGLIAEVGRLRKEKKEIAVEQVETKKLLAERELLKKKVEQLIVKIEEIE
jgi:regulator of replication initiation timing